MDQKSHRANDYNAILGALERGPLTLEKATTLLWREGERIRDARRRARMIIDRLSCSGAIPIIEDEAGTTFWIQRESE